MENSIIVFVIILFDFILLDFYSLVVQIFHIYINYKIQYSALNKAILLLLLKYIFIKRH